MNNLYLNSKLNIYFHIKRQLNKNIFKNRYERNIYIHHLRVTYDRIKYDVILILNMNLNFRRLVIAAQPVNSEIGQTTRNTAESEEDHSLLSSKGHLIDKLKKILQLLSFKE